MSRRLLALLTSARPSPRDLKSRRRGLGPPSVWLCTWVLAGAVACGAQKEGERCDTANGSADCDVGLRCVPGSELGLEGELLNTALCCPQIEAQITRSECGAGASFSTDPAAGGNGGAASLPPESPAPGEDEPDPLLQPDATAPTSSGTADASSPPGSAGKGQTTDAGSAPNDAGATSADAAAGVSSTDAG